MTTLIHSPQAVTTSAVRSDLQRELGDDVHAGDVLGALGSGGAVISLTGLGQCSSDPTLIARLIYQIAMAHRARSVPLRERDRQRLLQPDWFQKSDAIGYAGYTERFADDLPYTIEYIGYLQDLGDLSAPRRCYNAAWTPTTAGTRSWITTRCA